MQFAAPANETSRRHSIMAAINQRLSHVNHLPGSRKFGVNNISYHLLSPVLLLKSVRRMNPYFQLTRWRNRKEKPRIFSDPRRKQTERDINEFCITPATPPRSSSGIVKEASTQNFSERFPFG